VTETRHILFLVGIPASGKSTFAKEFLHERPHYKRVNKDELRYMIHDEDFKAFDRKKENFVVACRDFVIRQALRDGYNVIVDDTNIHEKHYNTVLQIAESFAQDRGIAVTVQVKVFDTPLDECIRRNANRVGPACVPEKVIRDMSKQLATSPLRREKGQTFSGCAIPQRLYVPGLPECVVSDMDGTAALLNGRNPYDARGCLKDLPNRPVVDLLKLLQAVYPIIIVSGREDQHHDETSQWLVEHGILYSALFMRQTGDKRKDSIIKREIYNALILPKYNVKFVLDDRNQVVDAIRGMGLPVFQVAPGNF